MTEPKRYNESLRARLRAYREAGKEGAGKPFTMAELARDLGVSATRVNKYLNLHLQDHEPEGDILDLENRVEELLKQASRRAVIDVTPFETNVISTLHATFELARKTNDVALVTGPAGIGKSVAIRLYRETHKLALAIFVPRWQRTDGGVQALLWDDIDHKTWDKQTSRAAWMKAALKNSNRPILIDNAQRMTQGAREWMFDLHDETGCPVIMVGNDEVLAAIRRNDQHFSRIGLFQEVKLNPKQIRAYAKQLVQALVPAPDPGLFDLAAEVAEQRGHLRALKKELLLMKDLVETEVYKGDQLAAFSGAHKKLVRDYEL